MCKRGFIGSLIALRKWRIAREILYLYGLDVPPEVKIGCCLELKHRALGTVIHPRTSIGDRVQLYHQVTIGRADAHLPLSSGGMERIEIGDDVVIFPGAKILGGSGVTKIGSGTVIAANAVLLRSTGENEIWAGIPARCVGVRGDKSAGTTRHPSR